MEISVIPSKPKRYYLPLSLSYDDVDFRCKRWQYSIRQIEEESNATVLRYFDAELFVHTTIPNAAVFLKSLLRNQHISSLSEMEVLQLKPITGYFREKSAENNSKQRLSLHLHNLSRSLTRTPNSSKQISQKFSLERPKDIRTKKLSRMFLAANHINMSSPYETGSSAIKLDDASSNADRNLDSNIKSPTTGYPIIFAEQSLKTTLVASAEKMKYVIYKTMKVLESPSVLKDKHGQRSRHLTYFTDGDSGASYV